MQNRIFHPYTPFSALEAGLPNIVRSEGIYLFDDESSAQAYLEGPIAAGLGQHPAVSDISVKQFEVLGDLTFITRGPV